MPVTSSRSAASRGSKTQKRRWPVGPMRWGLCSGPRARDASIRFSARAIVSSLPPFVTPVGVFVDQPAEEINRIASAARLGAIQLHGNERPDLRAIARSAGREGSRGRLIRRGDVDAWPANVIVLLDVHDPIRRGGTGQTVDWAAAAEIARRRRTILAGGLTAENVARGDRARPAVRHRRVLRRRGVAGD